MENIAAFQNACKALGVRESDVFQTVDLWERRNLNQVTNCLSALGSVVSWTYFHDYSANVSRFHFISMNMNAVAY